MARPIDADALKEQIESHVVSMSVCMSMDEHYGKVTMREECLQDIADAPTIDAIPVAWLKAQNNSTEYFKTIQGQAVELILELWQKEQEANHEHPDTPEDQS